MKSSSLADQNVALVSNITIRSLVIFCSKYNIADGMRQMFDPFERVARAHHICPCCERSFSPEEEDDFVKKVFGLYNHTFIYSVVLEKTHNAFSNWLLFSFLGVITAKS